MGKRIIKLTESDIHRIVKEAIENWSGSNNVQNPAKEYEEKKKRGGIEHNVEIMKSEVRRIQEVLHSALTSFKYGLTLPTTLNAMFIKQMPEGDEKRHMEDVLELNKKISEFYNYMRHIDERL